MALIKHRPNIRLMVPRVLLPGNEFCVTIVFEARRPVPVEWVDVTLDGLEETRVGSGQYQRRQRHHIIKLKARLAEEGKLPGGRTEYKCRFTIPRGSPPSYKGLAATVAYKMNVRASIPWWPDAKPSFWINVSPPPLPPAESKPLLYSTSPSGPQGRDPHMEVSLATNIFMPGDSLRGALALNNVADNWYHGLRAVLVGRETVTVGAQTERHKPHRYQFEIPFDDPAEGQSIPFALRVPQKIPASYRSRLWRLEWSMQFCAKLRWSRDLLVEVPLTMAPRPHSDGALKRQFHAPPSVGEERTLLVWRKVAKATGMDFDGESMNARRGEVSVTLWREHRGGEGVFVAAMMTCPDMHLDLRVERAKGLRRLGGGLSIGDGAWDHQYYVTGRERDQVRALLGGTESDEMSLVSWTKSATEIEMDDRELVFYWRDAGQSAASLERMAKHALQAAEQLERVRQRIPAPAVMSEAVAPWRDLAARLQAPLETSRMAVIGDFQGIPCRVVTAWDFDEPTHTLLELSPPLGVSTSHRLCLELEEGAEPREREGSVAELPGEARELLPRVVAGAYRLELSEEALQVFLEAPLMDPGPVYHQLGFMAQFLAAVQPNARPYR